MDARTVHQARACRTGAPPACLLAHSGAVVSWASASSSPTAVPYPRPPCTLLPHAVAPHAALQKYRSQERFSGIVFVKTRQVRGRPDAVVYRTLFTLRIGVLGVEGRAVVYTPAFLTLPFTNTCPHSPCIKTHFAQCNHSLNPGGVLPC